MLWSGAALDRCACGHFLFWRGAGVRFCEGGGKWVCAALLCSGFDYLGGCVSLWKDFVDLGAFRLHDRHLTLLVGTDVKR